MVGGCQRHAGSRQCRRLARIISQVVLHESVCDPVALRYLVGLVPVLFSSCGPSNQQEGQSSWGQAMQKHQDRPAEQLPNGVSDRRRRRRFPIPNSIDERQLTILGTFAVRLSLIGSGTVCVVLGYRLFIKGVSGQASLQASVDPSQVQLLNATPGLFLALVGAVILVYASVCPIRYGRVVRMGQRSAVDIVAPSAAPPRPTTIDLERYLSSEHVAGYRPKPRDPSSDGRVDDEDAKTTEIEQW